MFTVQYCSLINPHPLQSFCFSEENQIWGFRVRKIIWLAGYCTTGEMLYASCIGYSNSAYNVSLRSFLKKRKTPNKTKQNKIETKDHRS
jgi:hypothetical protein